MPIMPETNAELRLRHHFGADPYAPRNNILAGAAYLRKMRDLYGRGGFMAAYNTGPGRYEDHLNRGRPLPEETRAAIAPKIDAPEFHVNPKSLQRRPKWRFPGPRARARSKPKRRQEPVHDGNFPVRRPSKSTNQESFRHRQISPRTGFRRRKNSRYDGARTSVRRCSQCDFFRS